MGCDGESHLCRDHYVKLVIITLPISLESQKLQVPSCLEHVGHATLLEPTRGDHLRVQAQVVQLVGYLPPRKTLKIGILQ